MKLNITRLDHSGKHGSIIKYLPSLSCLLYLLIFLILITGISCHHNRLKTNEKYLAEEIMQEEKKRNVALISGRNTVSSDTFSRSPQNLNLPEIRSADPAYPPKIINIAGSLDNVRDMKLSDVASEITYIRIQQPPDSAFKKEIGFLYYLTDNYIIARSVFGVLQYSHDGRYINTIVKNEFTRINVSADMVWVYGDMTFIGAFNTTVKSAGDKLYYNYMNNISGQEYLMEYDCSLINIGHTISFDPENPEKVIGQGKILVDFNEGKRVTISPQRNQNGVWIASPDYLLQSTGTNWLDDNTYSKKLRGDNMLVIFNKTGDTLSTFTQHEKLVNYTKSLQRGTDGGAQYEYNSGIFFRNAFNDTVFQVIPPNRLLPVYVLNLGNYKVTRQQGVDPGFSLTGKIIPEKWAETKNYIFLTFTKDDYDCPNTRKNKTVKIYHALYSKQNGQLSVIKGDPLDYSPEILENDMDGGVPVWPSSYMISKNGEMMIPLKGKDIKERVKSKEFKLSGAPEAKKKELERLAGSVSDFEDILMIIK